MTGDRQGASILACGVLSNYGEGLAAMVDGIRSGDCPDASASGLGYPGAPLPRLSRLPAAPMAPWHALPGERGSAAALIASIAQMFASAGTAQPPLGDSDCALVVGTGGFLYASNAELFWRDRHAGAQHALTLPAFEVRGPAWGADLIARQFGMTGLILTLSTGCSSSANALLVATELLADGVCRRVLVVGAEGASAVTLSGFASLMLIDPDGCRPFDRNRAGLQLGEGVAALLLGRSDESRTQLLGGANRCDTHHLTSASPDGRVMAAVMQQALDSVGLGPADVAAIKAHGTGSPDSDAAEAHAIVSLFGSEPPPITGLKGFLGHTLGACGALETAALAGCLQAGFVPAAAGFATPDPALGVSPLRRNLAFDSGNVLLNFFGFGGNYTSLILRTDQR